MSCTLFPYFTISYDAAPGAAVHEIKAFLFVFIGVTETVVDPADPDPLNVRPDGVTEPLFVVTLYVVAFVDAVKLPL